MNPLQDLVLDALEARTPLRVAGLSHWIDAGRPVHASRIASLATHAGVVDYVPGDLTITVRAGTTLRELERVTRAKGQWLPLDPFGTSDGTVGATIATGSFGPLAHGFGRVRDLVLGVEFVSGDGRLVRGGGRVVKNVAGFDLVRLVTGSWGTIGIVTEATFRLYSLPQSHATIAMPVPDAAVALAQRIAAVLDAPVTPLAVELVDRALAVRLGLTEKPALLVELGGNRAAVASQRDALSRLGGAHEIQAAVWERLRGADDSASAAVGDHRIAAGQPQTIVIRISSLPARVATVWAATRDALSSVDGSVLHSTVSLGIVRCILPAGAALDAIQGVIAANPGCTFVYERLPSAMWPVLSPSVVSDRLAQGIKRAFDSADILNPGIMGPLS